MARSELIKFRVSPEEKALLVTAAGGARQLSGWLRDLGLRAAGQAEPEMVEAPPERQHTGSVKRSEEPMAKCPRWMHHRKGTYCGTCKTVPS